MNEIKKEAIKEFKENFYQLPGVKERDFINKYIGKATLAERERWQPVIDAWKIEGVNTNYHKEQQRQLSLKWPILYAAIVQALNPQDENK